MIDLGQTINKREEQRKENHRQGNEFNGETDKQEENEQANKQRHGKLLDNEESRPALMSITKPIVLAKKRVQTHIYEYKRKINTHALNTRNHKQTN